MKRVQLIEWGIIVVGLIFGYKFFESIIGLVSQLIFGFDSDMLTGKFLVRMLLVAAIYAICFVAIIRNSHQVASFVNGGAVNNSLPIKIGRRSALQIVLIAICVVQILSGLVDILIYIYDSFKTREYRSLGDDFGGNISKHTFQTEAVKVVVALVVVAFSKDLSNLFFRKNEPDELVLESKPLDDEIKNSGNVQ
ncbi:MAG TPA: hypothetical protein VHM26_04325 [Chitinophagaceae bacterium]|jgi:hypothetical protein|nr:hypothetical protein [Chitinophagaceae bacterium]